MDEARQEPCIPMELSKWLEEAASGKIETITRLAGGGQRVTYLVDMASGPERQLILQVAGDGGPYFNTGVTSLAREGETFFALACTSAAPVVPQCIGVSPDGDAILMVRSPGSSDFSAVESVEARKALSLSFARALAQLHEAGTSALGSTGHVAVGDGQDAAHKWLGTWESLLERVSRPAPLVRLAIAWLKENAPARDAPLVLCHGDLGPGNFLFQGQKVSKFVDWELSHLGDYHDDLGMLCLRGFQMESMEDLDATLAEYAKASGRRVDGWKVQYYRAVALILASVTTLAQLDKAVRLQKPLIAMPLYLHLLPMLQLWLAQALLTLSGQEVEEPIVPAEMPDMEALDVALSFSAAHDALDALGKAGGNASYNDVVAHMKAKALFGKSIEHGELDDIEAILGNRPGSLLEGRVELDRLLMAGEIDTSRLVQWAYRSARRQACVWPAWKDRFARDLRPIAMEYLP